MSENCRLVSYVSKHRHRYWYNDSKAKVPTSLHTTHYARELSIQFIFTFPIFTYIPAIIAGKLAFSASIHKSSVGWKSGSVISLQTTVAASLSIFKSFNRKITQFRHCRKTSRSLIYKIDLRGPANDPHMWTWLGYYGEDLDAVLWSLKETKKTRLRWKKNLQGIENVFSLFHLASGEIK